jgi:MFS family permease
MHDTSKTCGLIVFVHIGASYFVGRFFASFFWGVVADHIGRKPIVLLSSLFSVSKTPFQSNCKCLVTWRAIVLS